KHPDRPNQSLRKNIFSKLAYAVICLASPRAKRNMFLLISRRCHELLLPNFPVGPLGSRESPHKFEVKHQPVSSGWDQSPPLSSWCFPFPTSNFQSLPGLP